MSNGGFFVLGSIEAMRPVFLIVMGVFMLIFAWRLAKNSDTWTSRLMIAGALLLAFGYALMLPLYEAGVLERYAPNRLRYEGSAATAMGWHAAKLVVMNAGWLVFGIGLAMHAKILSPAAEEKNLREASNHDAHEFTA
jgi:hypothetical protein